MTFTPPTKRAALVREELRERIEDGRLQDGVQLPPEVELATSLGVSRTTVREALLQLEQEGLLIRRHGHGTFVRSRARLRGNLNLNLSASEVIRSHGLEPGTSDARLERRAATPTEAERLQLPAGADVLRLERVRTADGRPVIFTIDAIPARLFEDAGVDPDVLLDPALSIYRLYAERLGRSITAGEASLSLDRASAVVAERMGIEAGSTVLRIDQVDSTADGRPVLYSIEAYVADSFELSVHRRGPDLDPGGLVPRSGS